MSKLLLRPKLELPGKADKLLLHSCCAPCSAELMESLIASGINFTIFFYNPNIHPRKEYEMRKNENIRFAQKMNISFVDADYDTANWFDRVKGLEFEPERGLRCTVCFDMRLERAALYAYEHGFKVITSSVGVSRWKDLQQTFACGVNAVSRYKDMVYWTHNWRKNGGSGRMYEISKREGFYQQEYCGCTYSLRDTNSYRIQKGLDSIEVGKNFYAPHVVHSQKLGPLTGHSQKLGVKSANNIN